MKKTTIFTMPQIMPDRFQKRTGRATLGEARLTNRQLISASCQIEEYIRRGLSQSPAETKADHLIRWQSFIDGRARIRTVLIRDEFLAYRMFETLNDRGLRASQVDILKNYLFSRCNNRLDEAKAFWRRIDNIIEPLGGRTDGDDDEEPDDPSKSGDPLIHFFRHFRVTKFGPTKTRQLAEKTRSELTNEARVMRFMADAAEAAKSYVASFRGDDPKWRDYPRTAKQDVETPNHHSRIN